MNLSEMTDQENEQFIDAAIKVFAILHEEDVRTPGMGLKILVQIFGLTLMTYDIGPKKTKKLFKAVERSAETFRRA